MTHRAPDFVRNTLTGGLVIIGTNTDLEKFTSNLTYSNPSRYGSVAYDALNGINHADREPVWLTTEPQSVPKPDEPQYLNALVRGRGGSVWMTLRRNHNGFLWHEVGRVSGSRYWDDVDAIEVLYPGTPD